jgi:DNA-binding MarR family transcriptional regulator
MKKTPSDLAAYKPSDPKFRYRNYPFYWVARVGNRYAQRMEAKLKPLGLTITSWRVSLILREQGTLSVSEISAHSAVKLSTVTKTVNAMEEKGYLSVKQRESDARVSEISITKDGIQLIDNVVGQTSEMLDRALDGFTEDEIEQLNDLLQRLFVNLPNG